jgi:hypothetical protein
MTTNEKGFHQDIADAVLRLPVAAAFGLTFTALADGRAPAELAWRPEHSHTAGAFQANPIAALADFTGVAAKFLTEARATTARALRPAPLSPSPRSTSPSHAMAPRRCAPPSSSPCATSPTAPATAPDAGRRLTALGHRHNCPPASRSHR